MKKILCVIFALVLCISMFTSCGQKETSGKSFSMAVSDLPNTFDPQIVESSTEKIIALNCFDTLLRLDENGALQCLAAESYTVSNDRLVYTFKIRQGQKYFVSNKAKKYIEENGGAIPQSVTAKDFAYGIIRGILPETDAPDYDYLSAILNADKVHNAELDKSELGVKVIDDYTLQITLSRVDNNFLFSMSQPISAPCNESFFELTKGRYGLEQKYSIFNGAFYVSYTGNETSVTIGKNNEYMGTVQAVPSSVTFYENTDLSSVVGKLKKGNYDCAFVPSQYSGSLPNSVLKTNLTNTTCSLIFNLSLDKFKSVNMRKGLVSAIDITALTDSAATGVVAPDYYLAGKKISNNGVNLLKFDVQGAREEIKSAFDELNISTVSVNIICTKQNESIAKKIISDWQKNVGVELNGTLSVLPEKDFNSAIAKKDYDVAIYPVSVNNSNALEFMSLFTTDNSNNFLKYNSEEYDRIYENLKTNPTIDNLTYAQSFLVQNGIIIPLYFDSQSFCVANGVTGIYFVLDTSNVYFCNGRKQ